MAARSQAPLWAPKGGHFPNGERQSTKAGSPPWESPWLRLDRRAVCTCEHAPGTVCH